MKTRHKGKTLMTYFDQVPLEVVKKIAYREAQETEKVRPPNVFFEPSWRKAEPYSVPAGSLARDLKLVLSGQSV